MNTRELRIDRAAIVAALREIAARLQLSGDNPFRARAYMGGADAVEALSDGELKRRLQRGTLTEVEGIGGVLAAVIGELAKTGRADVLDRLRTAAPAALLELLQVPGMTKRRARLLHEALGVANVDELAVAARPTPSTLAAIANYPPLARVEDRAPDGLTARLATRPPTVASPSRSAATRIAWISPPAWIPAARHRGIPFVISTDAHAVADLDNVDYGVAMARRGGVRRSEVLNALPLAEFQAFIHP